MESISKAVLICPLDWGLGHATRCIPIIRLLIKKNKRVILAANGGAYQLLQKEFPDLPIFHLPPYDVRYYSKNMLINFLLQAPRICWTIRKEYVAVQKIVGQEKLDIVISDNRFGCYSRKAKSIFISHQLYPISPISWMSKAFHIFNSLFIRSFDACWIPDYEGVNNIAGRLSHPSLAMPTVYLGILSRMHLVFKPIRYDVLFLLSGPEPQRSRLERRLLAQIPNLKGNFVLVRGKTDKYEETSPAPNLRVISFLTSDDLNAILAESAVVVCRSGYSTIMDLVKLQKPALLIPTPGQTEQIYLAEYLEEQGIFPFQHQHQLDLHSGLSDINNYAGPAQFPLKVDEERLEKIIDTLFIKELMQES